MVKKRSEFPKAVSRLSDVKRERVNWLMPGYIPLGFPTIVAGKPGEGKSAFTIWLSARVSRGAPWGFVEGSAPRGNVLIISAEDTPEAVIGPRLDVQGGNDRLVHVLRGVPMRDKHEQWVLDQWTVKNLSFLRKRLDELSRVKLLVIDPVSCYMNAGGNVGVRRALTPLAHLAAEYELAMLLVSHLRKGEDGPVLEQIIDSTAYGAYPRSGLIFSRNPESYDKGIIALAKHNLGPSMPALIYRVDSVDHAQVGQQPMLVIEGTTDKEIGPQLPMMSLQQEVQAWVRKQLDRLGFALSTCLFEQGKDLGYSPDQIRRAAKRIGARHRKEGFGENSGSLWELSELRTKRAKERQVGACCMKAIFEVFRKSRQPMKLSTIIMEIERRGYDLPRQGIYERIRGLKSNKCLSRQQKDNGAAVYWFSDDLESDGDRDSR